MQEELIVGPKQPRSFGDLDYDNHLVRDLVRLFPRQFHTECDAVAKQTRTVNLLVFASFVSNIVIFIMKIAALAISRSSAVLASLLDSITDILCGVVLFAAIQRARSGIRSGQLQR